MMSSAELAEIGSLVGDPTRAVMLSVLMDGRALTAGELAYFARVSAQTTSLHLRKLTEANLLSVVDQGRHRYFRIASPLVAQMLETIVTIGAVQAPPRYRPRSQADAALRTARLCYDHLAGRLAVAMADALIERAAVTLGPEGGEVTPEGVRFLASLGVHIDNERRMRRTFCRPCLDFTERRFHIAGFVGAALARHCLDAGWVKRTRDSRAVSITPMGQTEFLRTMGIDLGALAEAA
jgi:DNA-binding transcriptional ArsR family regulator